MLLAALLTALSSAAPGSWPATGVAGKIFDGQCPDLQNLSGQTVGSCEAACDAHASGGCSAINIDEASGACALRACPCGAELAPAGALAGFTAFRRADGAACPPSFARVLGSSMVLQRAPLRARVFGRAAPRALLTVELATGSDPTLGSRTSSSVRAIAIAVQADDAGEWACLLPATPATSATSATSAGASYNLSVALAAAADGHVAPAALLTDVVFGDVFVCGGQSNMQEPLSVVNNASAEFAAAAALGASIRLAVVGSASSAAPLRDVGGALALPWQRASAAALGANNAHSWSFFSATCWLTATAVSRALGPAVPLGLVGSYVGGTPIESWTPGLNPNAKDAQGHKSAVLFNAMVAPLTGLAVRCFLWYQGENNSFKPSRWVKYATDFPRMIALWRQAWVNGTGQAAHASTPFGFVQIGPRDCAPDADHQGNVSSSSTFYGGVRWAQTAFRYAVPNAAMPGTFMAVAADLAEGYSPVLPLAAGCVHFGDKQAVGRRLALGVRKAVYGHAVAAVGPMVVAARAIMAGGAPQLLVSFHDEAGGPLELRNASGFELSLDGERYVGAPIVAHAAASVTLAVPAALGGNAVASLRYILHDTPCINQTCAVYSAASGLPSPPLVANLPGHAGADPVGWDM